MTSQEILKFVNQPKPRSVPRSISRKEIDEYSHWRYKESFFYSFCIVLLVIFFLGKLFVSDVLLDIGHKITVQGTIASMKLFDSRNNPYYSLRIKYHTPNGEMSTSCYVDYKNDIPGWGLIPETRNNPDLQEIVFLKNPFPIAIEYIPWNPSAARAVGTRSSPFSYFKNLIFVVIAFVGIPITLRQLHRLRRPKYLLEEGLFVTGHVFEPAGRRKKPLSFFVWFIDQHGMRREGFCKVPQRAFSVYNQWVKEERSVGLLYLPDQEEVIITDLWLEDYQ